MEDAKPKATTSQAEACASADDVPQDVRPYDILCGRSKTCFNNIGNRRFRITISMNVEKYDTITNRTERGKFIASLARTFKEDVGFRFVRISKKNGRVELSDEEIRAKIGHALRDLSKAKAEAAAAAAMPVGMETKKIMELSSKPPLPSTAMVVTPEPQTRRVTNDFETDSNGKLMAFPQIPNIRKKNSIMDAAGFPKNTTSQQQQQQQDVPKAIFFSPQQQQEQVLHPVLEDSPLLKSSRIQSRQSTISLDHQDNRPATLKQAPVREEIGDDDYCLMPLTFDDEPNAPGLLDAIQLDVLSGFASEQMMPKARTVSMPNMISQLTFEMYHHDHHHHHNEDASIASVRYNDDEAIVEAKHGNGGFIRKMHQQSNHSADLMSLGSNDDHMISLCESVDCLSLDLDIHP
ncbi:unnamed protein product [Cylindrotheca closterium]|uniref:DUF6824 domain-containing protein n=1 Tax=Cylindrotheca closterium TaxID=2856 RepID=A0AAD2JHF8_9STRA|nr:unnamed protein product [Cylindrotheca closterium]